MNQIVYFDGQFLAEEQARVPLATHALQYGTGCFEGIRGYKTADRKIAIFRPKEHFERLLRSAKILRINVSQSADELVEAAKDLLRKNQITEDIYLRPFAFKSGTEISPKMLGVKDSLAIYTVKIGQYLAKDQAIKVCTSSWRRMPDAVLPSRAKVSGAYITSSLAKTEALENGFDEAIFLTLEGKVSEGSGENLFMVRNGQLVTPDVSQSILEGITRASVIELVKSELNLEVIERPIDRSELYIAEEVFLTGTAAEITAVGFVDQRIVDKGEIGPITKKLQDLFNSIVRGQNEKFQSWLER